MRLRGLVLSGLGVCALAAPASAQIIATSIPREDTGGAGAASGKKFALHFMASPFAKWKINSYVEEPKGSELLDFQQAATTDSKSKFIAAAELAFAVGSDVSIGVGGWYNTLGEPDVEVFEFSAADGYLFAGTATQKLHVSEVHGNIFYKSLGVQVGLVRTSATVTGLRAGSEFLFLETGDLVTITDDVTLGELDVAEEKQTANNWDAFLVYKKGSAPGSRYPFGVSVGAGVYRDSQAGSSKFSGFATASVALFKGLGLDASYWHVGGSKPSPARQELATFLEGAVSDSLSRFTIGIGYSF
jgi:hypothetical protein